MPGCNSEALAGPGVVDDTEREQRGSVLGAPEDSDLRNPGQGQERGVRTARATRRRHLQALGSGTPCLAP